MIHAEMISINSVFPAFHACSEQLTGLNPAKVVQVGKKPRGQHLLMLAYLRAFNDPKADTSDIRFLAGMLHVGIMCAGPDIELAEVTAWPHGLRCLSCEVSRTGVVGIVFMGDGEQWSNAIHNACNGPREVVDWGLKCYQQFAKLNMAELIGVLKIQNSTYLIQE